MIQDDSEKALFERLEKSSVDLVLTSPPYANAIDYPRSHKFSEWWLYPGEKECKRRNYLGLRRYAKDRSLKERAERHAPKTFAGIDWLTPEIPKRMDALVYRYVCDMKKIIDGCRRVLRDSGRLVFVIADNSIRGNKLPVGDLVVEMLESAGFRRVNRETREIKSSSRRYPFGNNGFDGIMKEEHILTASL